MHEKTSDLVLDFSASINPYPPRFEWECSPACLSYYPDNTYTRLKEVIADTFHRDTEEICVGNGSIELIRVFCSIAFSKKGKYFVESPTFGEYALSAKLAGATPANATKDADVAFCCNPNNPDGTLRSRDQMLELCSEVSEQDGIFFADEAFIELSDPDQSLVNERDNHLFVLRSLTKCFSVPGIRFGYGFGDPVLIRKIEIARPPWSVNAYAEAFAIQAFRHMDELAASRDFIAKEREWLAAQLGALGYKVKPSSVNYLLVDTGKKVTPLCTEMERYRILFRDCTSFGLPTCFRTAVRTREENTCLVEALASCVR